jgi:CheY-like chemotaxis protein
MNLRILSVEDKAEDRDRIEEIVKECDERIDVVFADNRDAAIELLKAEFFDLAILDLKIPAISGDLDTSPEHGLAVLSSIQHSRLGISVILLTGSPAEELIDGLLSYSSRVDVWGSGSKWPTIRFVAKGNIASLLELLRHVQAAIASLNDVECRSSENLPEGASLKRLVQIIVKQRNGSSYEVRRVGGGLSGALVLQIKIKNNQGVQTANIICKCASIEQVSVEERKYKDFADRLKPGATPRFLSSYLFGAGSMGAATYSMADGFDRDLFSLATGVNEPELALRAAFDGIRPWSDGVAERQVSIKDIRKKTLNDAKFAKIVVEHNLDWAVDFERRTVQARWCPTHGDFHGGNVLVNTTGEVQIIDYNDIDDRPPSFDWVTLELSLFCARNGPARDTGWPSIQDCAYWADVNTFSQSGPFEAFVKACRKNAESVAPGRREVLSCAYAYLVRQLWYDDTDHDVIKALLEAIRSAFD